MSRNEWARQYVVRTLKSQAICCPSRYLSMLAETPAGGPIRGLAPWIFLPYPEYTSVYCSEACNQPVLPFAQALGEDLIACFQNGPANNPTVIVLNPWTHNKRLLRRAELPSFDTWLSYAYHVSRGVGLRSLTPP